MPVLSYMEAAERAILAVTLPNERDDLERRVTAGRDRQNAPEGQSRRPGGALY